ncbi:MAG: alkaline phosphatase [Flavobacteriaceae bacterium]|nr:alkaline phosphatase [Flavobacteriaceae bacterium]
MNRRDFLKKGALATMGGMLLTPFGAKANMISEEFKGKKAKNIIFMVSDGMSVGTLMMADIYLKRKNNKASNWIQLYEDDLVQRAVMDMASANAIVTDSAAASSSWGGGVRVNNGSLNISPNGKENMPILQKFKKAGKKVGCITTVPITHATPAGFCVTSKRRSAMDYIAEMYADLDFDVMMGGGRQYFDEDKRKDEKDVFALFKKKGYSIAQNKSEMQNAPKNKPLLGTFDEDAVPYTIDHKANPEAVKNIPTLAEMAQKAIDQMKDHSKGFVLQIEGGKVDWAAHGNDIGALLFDQIAFDEAIKVVMDFAKKDKNTLVIITSDHGNANPGLIYGRETNDNFDHLQKFTQSNEWILQGINANSSLSFIKERVAYACGGWAINDEQVKELLSYYTNIKKEDGLYNPKRLPFRALAEMQKSYTSVGWISMDHSSDYTELAMYGPGSENLKGFVKNTDMHSFMLNAAHVENKF